MENRAHALAAGLFVVMLTLALLGAGAWLTRERGPRDLYEISTREPVTGLQSQAPVRLRGLDIGKVGGIAFDPARPGNVLITLEIDGGVPLTTDTFATLGYQGVTGLAFVQLSDRGRPGQPLARSAERPPLIPLEPGLMARLESRGEAILQRVEEASGQLARVLGDDNQKRLVSALARLDEAAGSATQLARRLDDTAARHLNPALDEATQVLRSVGRSADEVTRTAAEVTRTAADYRGVAADLRQTASEFSQTARRLNEKDGPIDRLAEGTQALARAADTFNLSTLPRIHLVTEETSRAVRLIGRTAGSIQDNPQALIFGSGAALPGPGEPGFQTPGGKP